MTSLAVGKMAAVWVLAFVLYGPAIIFWEFVVGSSNVPEDECFAEFYYTWYFLLSASIFEFFSPFVSVAFFNLSIYLNIRRRNKSRAIQMKELGSQPLPQGSSVFFVKTCRVSSSEAKVGASVVVEEEDDPTSASHRPNHNSSVPKKKGAPSKQRPVGTRPYTAEGGHRGLAAKRIAQHSRLFRDKKIAKSLAIIVCIFGACWAPYTLLMIIRAACRGRCVDYHWYEITFWLLWLNSAINPFLYPLCHSSFKRAFIKILGPKRQSIQPQIEIQS
ncbi:hypothetical protein AAFF_G00039650 [Aldrovandia affinis]|uniref:G-protein coupled receptors family 1 profile domain-containing protein n=1 Tax=Aldrovandia affinis TaxID=143900 RepID=A0AAD7S300_9TELE|nr:hypothetical protein AAFF_G00039650 [Aldrovandia affinis]